MDQSLELTLKALSGEHLTDEEKLFLRAKNIKYELVRALVMEKLKAEGKQLVNLHFSPGPEFYSLPTLDMATELINFCEASKNAKKISFDDYCFKKSSRRLNNAISGLDGSLIRN